MKPDNVIWFLLLLGLALAVRLTYIATQENSVYWPDECDYLTLARNISSGSGFVLENNEPTAYRAPGYPMVLSALRWFGVIDVRDIRIVQAMMGVAFLALLFVLARTWFSEKAGLVAVGLGAIYPYFVYMTGSILATTWYTLLIVGGTVMCFYHQQHQRWWTAALFGLIWGIAVLTRPVAFVLLVVLLFWAIFISRFRLRRHHALISMLTLGLIVIPWSVRNSVVMGMPGLVSNTGYNLWLGNNPSAKPEQGSSIDVPDTLMTVASRLSSEQKQNEFWMRQALLYIRSHPIAAAQGWLEKGMLFWRPDPSPTTKGVVRRFGLIWWIGVASFTPLLLLALLSPLISNPQQRRYLVLWFGFGFAYTLVHALFFVKVRFRLPLEPFIILAAAHTLVSWIQILRSKILLSIEA